MPDLRETFNIGDEHDEHDNPWPSHAALPGFKPTMLSFYDALDSLHLDVLRCLAVGMGLDRSTSRRSATGAATPCGCCTTPCAPRASSRTTSLA